MTCKEQRPKQTYVKGKFGLDPEELVGYAQNIDNIIIKAKEWKSPDASIERFTVRSKPVTMLALYIDDIHIVTTRQGEEIGVRKSGWLVRGPGGLLMYVKEEDFNTFFEIVQDK